MLTDDRSREIQFQRISSNNLPLNWQTNRSRMRCAKAKRVRRSSCKIDTTVPSQENKIEFVQMIWNSIKQTTHTHTRSHHVVVPTHRTQRKLNPFACGERTMYEERRVVAAAAAATVMKKKGKKRMNVYISFKLFAFLETNNANRTYTPSHVQCTVHAHRMPLAFSPFAVMERNTRTLNTYQLTLVANNCSLNSLPVHCIACEQS